MFCIPQRLIRDLRQVATQAFGRERKKRRRRVRFSSQDSTLTLTIKEGPTTLRYKLDTSDAESRCFELSLADLRSFESSALASTQFAGDPSTGRLTVSSNLSGASYLEQTVPVVACDRESPSEARCPNENDTALPKTFRQRLAEATRIADPSSGRDALRCLCLSGTRHSIEATDGRRAFVAHGCQWPWRDEILIERSGWFDAQAIRSATRIAGSLGVRPSGDDLTFVAGPWSLTVPRLEHRFPDVSRIVPRDATAESTLRLNRHHRETLQAAVKLAKRRTAHPHAMTLEVRRRPVVRFEVDGTTQEVVIGAASLSGQDVCVAVSLSVLDDLIRLESEELRLVDAHKPVWSRSKDSTYVAMPLHPDFITAASEPACRAKSDQAAVSTA